MSEDWYKKSHDEFSEDILKYKNVEEMDWEEFYHKIRQVQSMLRDEKQLAYGRYEPTELTMAKNGRYMELVMLRDIKSELKITQDNVSSILLSDKVNLKVIKFLLDIGLKIDQDKMNLIQNIEILEFIKNKYGMLPDIRGLSNAIYDNKPETFLWIFNNGIKPEPELLTEAIKQNLKTVIKVLLDYGYVLGTKELDEAFFARNNDLIVKMLNEGIQPSNKALVNLIRNDKLDLLKFLGERYNIFPEPNKTYPKQDLVKYADATGDDDLIKWVKENV